MIDIAKYTKFNQYHPHQTSHHRPTLYFLVYICATQACNPETANVTSLHIILPQIYLPVSIHFKFALCEMHTLCYQ